jgi:zinc protease
MHDSFEKTGEAAGITAWRHLGNGLDVLVLPDKTAPVAAFMVTYRVGSRNEGAGLTGATHFLEHLMFKGSTQFNKAAGTSVFQTLQRVGAQVNATTWNDRTNYYEVLPSEHLDLAMRVEADRMRGALLTPSDVDSERTVILNELDRGENEPIRKLYQSVWSVAFLAHPYHHPTIGWRSDVETLSAEGLRGFYETYYWPDNATISVIGDTDTREALRRVDQHFGALGRRDREVPEVNTREPGQMGARRVTIRMAGQLGANMMAFKSPAAADPRTDALALLGAVLSRGKSSRLFRSLVDSGKLTSASAATSRFRDPGLFYVMGMLAPGTTHEETESTVLSLIEDVAKQGVTETEIERGMSQLRAEVAYLRDGPYGVAAQLNEAIAAGDWQMYTNRISRMESVSTGDVQQAAALLLVEDQMTVGRFQPVVD